MISTAETTLKMERQQKEKIFTANMAEKDLITLVNEELLQVN